MLCFVLPITSVRSLYHYTNVRLSDLSLSATSIIGRLWSSSRQVKTYMVAEYSLLSPLYNREDHVGSLSSGLLMGNNLTITTDGQARTTSSAETTASSPRNVFASPLGLDRVVHCGRRDFYLTLMEKFSDFRVSTRIKSATVV